MSFLRMEGGASFDGSGYILRENSDLSLGHILLESEPATDPSSYAICDRSGFRAKRSELRKTWDGLMVLPEFFEERSHQDRLSVRTETKRGAKNPEPIGDETFLTVSTGFNFLQLEGEAGFIVLEDYDTFAKNDVNGHVLQETDDFGLVTADDL